MRIAYLDEFGHIGPYVSRTDAQYKTHPVFGFAGVLLPADRVRDFGSFFFTLKNKLLGWELANSGVRPAQWEKKGGALLTTKNIQKYEEVRAAINRVLNKIESLDGKVFFYGQVKPKGAPVVGLETSRQRYDHALIQSVIRLTRNLQTDERLMMILDEVDDKSRLEALASISGFMFSDVRGRKLVEPPLQVESHLYQSVQAADWICALLGRLSAYLLDPEWAEFSWADMYFAERIAKVALTGSKVWCPDDDSRSITPSSLLNRSI